MPQPFEIYKNYSSTQFAMDDYFIQWVYLPSEENTAFWLEFQDKYPEQVEKINRSRDILLSFNTSHENISEDIKAKVWSSIISQSSKGKIFNMPGRRFWMAAASVFILLVGISYFLLINDNTLPPTEIVGNEVLKSTILPGGNKATLTLADGSQIVLDSAKKGAISQQGNTKVVKESEGKLAYQPSAMSHEPSALQYNIVTTPRGGQYQLVLADGTKVWLNAASSIRFPTAFPGKERTVAITGEAYFEVAHDAKKPFHVSVNGADIRVLGTHFNVNAYDDNGVMKTTLLEGSIKISKGSASILIKRGQQAQVEDGADGIKITTNVNLDQVVAWKNGLFQFDGANLKAIMRQAARWYDVNVIYEGKIDETFSGSTQRAEHISHLLKILEATGKVTFQINGNQLIVKSK